MPNLQFYIDYLKSNNSGQYDDEHDLAVKAQQVKDVVEDVDVPEELISLLLRRAIGDDLHGAVFGDQTTLRGELLDFTLLARAHDDKWVADLKTYLEKKKDADMVTPEMFFQDVVVPTFEKAGGSITFPEPTVYHRAPRIRRTDTSLVIDGGKFGVIAGVAGPGEPTFQFLQFASSDRVADYSDGSTTTKTFDDLYDIDEERAVTAGRPGEYVTVGHADAPRWRAALRLGTAALTRVKVADTYTTHLVRRLKPGSFEILWTVVWTFTVAYGSGEEAAAYQVGSAKRERRGLTLPERPVRANGVEEKTVRA
uniref:hypothetical protein n=1 Tax=Herbidospora sakaeratensis TaxID=564415 RepID=UPI0007845BA5|nr:hypothetical protein [Herbidospora sakaeratensis]